MGRFLLGIALMLALLGAGLMVWKEADDTHTPVSRTLEEASDAALSGRLEEAREKAQQARARWEGSWHASAAFSDHGPMDEIDGLFAQIEGCSDTELAALCRRIASLVSAVAEAHSLTWWNLL